MKSRVALTPALLFAVIACAQDSAQDAGNQPPVQLQVLKSWRADLGDHSIYLNRVVPPVLPTVPVKVESEVAAPLAAPDRPKNAKKSETLFLFANVYEHQFTELSWMEGAEERSAVSNVDFNLLSTVTQVENADMRFGLLMMVVNRTTGGDTAGKSGAASAISTAARRDTLLPLANLDPAHAQYRVVAATDGRSPSETMLGALDAIHHYFDANRQQLAEDYAKREAARIAEESRPKPPPPPRQDIVVHFWPGPGTQTLDLTSGAETSSTKP